MAVSRTYSCITIWPGVHDSPRPFGRVSPRGWHTGPLAVAGASRTGMPAAITAAEARDQLGYAVTTYLEAGPCSDPIPSTIVDCTGPVPRVLRNGAIALEKLREVVPHIEPFVLA